VGEYLILLGSFEVQPWMTSLAVTGVIFGAVYLLVATRKLLYGPLDKPENARSPTSNLREVGLLLPIVVLFFWIGFRAEPFLARTDASVDALLARWLRRA